MPVDPPYQVCRRSALHHLDVPQPPQAEALIVIEQRLGELRHRPLILGFS